MRYSRSRRPDWRGVAVAIAVVLLGLASAEGAGAAWSAHRRIGLERRPDGALLIVRDPALGWRATPGRDIPVPGGRFTTDARGWPRHDAATSQPLLLVLGDSCTHAAGGADGAAYHDVIARRLGVAVAALGVNGYGTCRSCSSRVGCGGAAAAGGAAAPDERQRPDQQLAGARNRAGHALAGEILAAALAPMLAFKR